MIILDSTSKSLVAVLAGAVAAAQPIFNVSYADTDGTIFTEMAGDGLLNGVAEVELVAAPAAGHRRLVRTITIFNDDTADATFTLSIKNGSNARRAIKKTLIPGDSYVFPEPAQFVKDHGTLIGLLDDDHTQYYSAARHTKELHDALGINADTLDGSHAAAFALAGHNHSGVYDPFGEADAERAAHEAAFNHSKIHDRLHGLASAQDHNGITGAENNFMGIDSAGRPKDSGSKAADFAGAGHNHDAAYAPVAKGVDNGNAHDHAGGDGAQVDHGGLAGLGDDDHSQYLHLNKAGQTLSQNLSCGAGVTIDGVDVGAHAAGDAKTQHGSSVGSHTHQSGPGEGGTIDHGAALTGLGDDDHSQYLNNTRHDTTARHGSSVVDHGGIGGLSDNDHTQYARSGPCFFASKNSDQDNITTTTDVKVTFTSENWDSDNTYDAANSKWVPGKAGTNYWIIGFQVYVHDLAANSVTRVVLYKNGVAQYISGVMTANAAGTESACIGTFLAQTTSDTDYFELYVWTTTASNAMDINGIVTLTWWYGMPAPRNWN